ncbi:acyltransferase family protein [Lysobacter tyrosinilyticus]
MQGLPLTPAARAEGRFRPDINGLRAWAVLSVIFYHFAIPGFAGGFVGVDVFLVISGFLMTGIIISGLEDGRFSFAGFVAARARRIVPALAVLCTVLFATGWLVLSAPEYLALSTQILSSLLFVSNFQFWSQSGYFDAAAHDKWLLHTWSLSVEWQFYLVLPVLVVAFWRIRPGARAATVWLALWALLSLGICQAATSLDASAAFYLLPSRAWELLLGGLVYLLQRGRPIRASVSRPLEVIGFLLIAGSIIGLDAAVRWPGWLALAPVVGTACVISAARGDSALSGPRFLQWIGDRSYSLYLWHWPIVVALSFLERREDWGWLVAGLVGTGLLAQLSYRYIEEPFRRSKAVGLRNWKTVVITGLALVPLGGGLMVIGGRGIPGRIPPSADYAAREASNRYPKPTKCFASSGNPGSWCLYGSDDVAAILVGDSHADAVATAVAAASKGRGVYVWSFSACPTLFGAHRVPGMLRSGAECPAFNAWVERTAEEMPSRVPMILLSRTSIYALGPTEHWDAPTGRPLVYYDKVRTQPDAAFRRAFSEDIIASACRLARHHPVYLVGPIPEMGVDVPKATSRAIAFGIHDFPSITLRAYHQRHDLARNAMQAAWGRCGVRFLDPVPLLCTGERCSGTQGARPLYYDDDHLSEYGNRRLVPMFSSVFAEEDSAASH